MWGHPPECRCPVCASFYRCFALVHQGWQFAGFGALAAQQIRSFEGELRDLYGLCLAQGRRVPPNPTESAPPQAPGSGEAPQAVPAPPEPRETPGTSTTPGEEAASTSQPLKAPEQATAEQFLAPKYKPAPPPKTAVEVVKTEPSPSPEPLVDVEETGTAGVEKSAPSRPHKSRSRRRRSSRSLRSRRGDKRSRSRRRRRDKGEDGSPRTSRGREKKRRSGSPVRPKSPLHPPGPRSPPGPPPRRQPQGHGWFGPVPYSNHPRWDKGTNKGVVKKAKQERFNQRQRREQNQWPPRQGRR